MSTVLPAVLAMVAILESRAEVSFEQEVRLILEDYCFDCHGADGDAKGDLNLERFVGEEDVMAQRGLWAGVFGKIESHQMPPPKRKSQPSRQERATVLQWVREVAGRPDPKLGKRDPGKLDEYLESVRATERRLEFAEKISARMEKPPMAELAGIPERRGGLSSPSGGALHFGVSI